MISIPSILEELQRHYDQAVRDLRADVIAFGKDGTLPPERKRTDGSYAYPQLTLHYSGVGDPKDRSSSRAPTPRLAPAPTCSRPISPNSSS